MPARQTFRALAIQPKSETWAGALAVVLLLALLSLGPVANAKTLNLGIVSSSPSKMVKRFGSFLKYLESKGFDAGRVVTAPTVAELSERFRSGEVDLMFESPYGAVQMIEGAGAQPLLIREKSGTRQYKAVIFVKADSEIRSLSDLAGKVIAFEDPDSTSSYHLPRQLITDAGLELVESRKPVAGKVAYYFSKDDANTIAQVAAGRVADAGGIKFGAIKDRSNFRALNPASVMVPRHVVLAGPGVDGDAMKKALLAMAADEQAKEVLQTMKTPTGFSEFDGDPRAEMRAVAKALGL